MAKQKAATSTGTGHKIVEVGTLYVLASAHLECLKFAAADVVDDEAARQTGEMDYIRDKRMQEIDDELFYAIDEKAKNVDLLEKGREVMSRNALEQDDMVSCIFTCTPDLNAQFPAVAARRLGLNTVPLMCACEMNVPNGMPRVIRMMLHYYGPAGQRPVHTYIGEAQNLRADLEAAQ